MFETFLFFTIMSNTKSYYYYFDRLGISLSLSLSKLNAFIYSNLGARTFYYILFTALAATFLDALSIL